MLHKNHERKIKIYHVGISFYLRAEVNDIKTWISLKDVALDKDRKVKGKS